MPTTIACTLSGAAEHQGNDLYLIDAETGDLRRLTSDLHITAFVQSPNGQQIAFVAYPYQHIHSTRRLEPQLYVINVIDAQLQPLLHIGHRRSRLRDTWSHHIAWLPDEQSLSFLVHRGKHSEL